MNTKTFRRTLVVAAALSASLLGGSLQAQASSTIPFGTVLIPGSAWAGQYASLGDLNVYSNGDNTYGQVGTYGEAFQCTELVMRWAALRFGEPNTWDATSASDMWNVGPRLPIPLTQEPNGGPVAPAFGDIVVYASTSYNPTGHVAVVSAVTGRSVTIVQQNSTMNGVPTGNATLPISGTYMPPMWGLPIIGWLHHGASGLDLGASVHIAQLGGGTAASAISVSNNRIAAAQSNGNGFTNPTTLSSSYFFGTRGTVFADLSGKGRPSSAVAINDSSIWVELNTGAGTLSAPQNWSSGAFYGSRGTYLADVDGSGRASAVAINDDSIWVMLNSGDHFGPPQQWSSGAFYGNRGTYMAVIDGSGRASAVAVNDDSAWMLPNSGGSFGSPTRWTSTPFYGNRATVLADLDGSGRASLVAMNDTSIWVEANLGPNGGFSTPQRWASVPFFATSEYMADVDGSGRASAVVASSNDIWVAKNTGGSFGYPSQFYSANQ
ncbi:MAG: CHAP domain-containing protein [Candidatus Dormibacteraeota bacterium]|uniref:CHAP domain-containing protein n=1 Tax=Candidatus Amunia macphersoniae TaxID=3127014 RepID=A0A934NJ34_9BACT|nr:CHAP domain-containing protein [Candidatus Dormibacteraeota bacterium]